MKNRKSSSLDGQEQNAAQEEPFLQRWSKRKLETAKKISEGVEDTLESSAPDQRQDFIISNQTLEQPHLELTDEDMPPLETLDEHSDYSGFLSPKVSETLRRQALRKLFHLPQLNIPDGLNDYDEDYTHFEQLGDVVTHEMKRLLQQDAEKVQEDTNDAQKQDATVQAVNQTENSKKLAANNETAGNLEINESKSVDLEIED